MRLIDADILKTVIERNFAHPEAITEIIDIQPTAPQFEKWISVEDRLPDAGDRILIAVRLHNHEPVQLDEVLEDGDGIYLDSSYEFGSDVTHWMPLPEPPKEDSHETD